MVELVVLPVGGGARAGQGRERGGAWAGSGRGEGRTGSGLGWAGARAGQGRAGRGRGQGKYLAPSQGKLFPKSIWEVENVEWLVPLRDKCEESQPVGESRKLRIWVSCECVQVEEVICK